MVAIAIYFLGFFWRDEPLLPAVRFDCRGFGEAGSWAAGVFAVVVLDVVDMTAFFVTAAVMLLAAAGKGGSGAGAAAGGTGLELGTLAWSAKRLK